MDALQIFEELLQGFSKTASLFAITLVFAIPLGFIIAFGSMSKFKPLKYLVRGIVWVVRGTPLLLQCLFFGFLPTFFGLKTKDIAGVLNIGVNDVTFMFVCIAFSINYACYLSEIFRGGIESIPKGQYEAGQVLGMTKRQVFFKVVLLQVIKKILAPTSNEVITLVKDTSILSMVGAGAELFTTAKQLVNTYVVLTPFIYVAVFYLVFNGALTLLFGLIEKKLSYFKE